MAEPPPPAKLADTSTKSGLEILLKKQVEEVAVMDEEWLEGFVCCLDGYPPEDYLSFLEGNDFQANQMTNDLGEVDMTNIVGAGEMVPLNKMESMRQFCNDVLKLNSRLLEIALVDGTIKEADVSRPYVNLLIDSLRSSDNVDLQEYVECIVQGNSCSKEKKPLDHLLMTLASEWTQNDNMNSWTASEWTQNDNMNSWTIGRTSHDFNKLVPQHLAVAHLSCIRLGMYGGRLVQNLMWRCDKSVTNIKLPVAYFCRVVLYTLNLVQYIKKQESYSSCTMVSSNLEPESTICHEDEPLFGDLFWDRGLSVGSIDGYDESVIAASSLPLHAAAKLFIILKTSAFSPLWTYSIYENAHKKLTAYLLVMKAKEVTSIQAEVRFDGIKTDRVFSSLLGQCEVIYGSLSDGLEGFDYGMGSGGSKKRGGDGYEVAEPLTGKKPRRELIEPDKLSNLWPHLEMQPLPRMVRGRLLERIARSRLRLKHVDGDGNCQFRAVSKVLSGTQKHYKEVRAKVVKEMTDNSKVYMDYGSSIDKRMKSKSYFDDYVKKMAKDKTWGDFITLFAATNVWHVRVTLLCSYKDVAVKEFVPTNLRIFKDIYLCYDYRSSCCAHYDALMLDEDIRALNPTPSPKQKPLRVPFGVMVKNIPYRADSDRLRDLFLGCGGVLHARVIHKDGKSRGFGFVEMEDNRAMQTAIAALDGRLWLGRNIIVTKDMKNYHDLEANAGV